MGKVGGEGSPLRSLTWDCGWVNKARRVRNLLLEALSPEPGDEGMPRQCTGLPGEERLWLVAWSLFLCLSLDSRGNHWERDGQCGVPGRGVDEISQLLL